MRSFKSHIRTMPVQLTDFDALTFDCYGTLIDWESGMLSGLADLAARAPHSLSPDEILEAHAFYESTQQRITPAMRYSELLAVVYRRIAEEWRVGVSLDECDAYGRSMSKWPAFPDTVQALAYLKQHYRLVILSNVDRASFRASLAHLRTEFDAIYTAQDIGSYKPSLRNFEYMIANLGRLGIEKGRILHTAESLFHDHRPANEVGLASCWIERRHGRTGFGATMHPGEMPRTDFRFTSLAGLVDAHRQVLAAG